MIKDRGNREGGRTGWREEKRKTRKRRKGKEVRRAAERKRVVNS